MKIHEARGFAQVDIERLRALIERGFESRLREDFFHRGVSSILVAEDYMGAAILLTTELGMYLTKFVVDPAARGCGVGGALWRRVTTHNPHVFWRARCSNPITPWYIKLCHGVVHGDAWNVFWHGPFDSIHPAQLVNYALQAPVDLFVG